MATPAFSRKKSAPRPPDKPASDPFRLGWRWARPGSVNGSADSEGRVPLTADDLLHPQEGDQIPENTIQERDRGYLAGALRFQLRDHPRVRVLSDCLVNWGVPGLKNHSPDISVFDDVSDPDWQGGTFWVVQQGARPLLVIEIVSPDSADAKVRRNDVVIKVDHYYRAGVPLYAIIDQEEEGGPRRLLGYRRGRRGYLPLPLDEHGRLPLKPVGLLLGLRATRPFATTPRRAKQSSTSPAWPRRERRRPRRGRRPRRPWLPPKREFGSWRRRRGAGGSGLLRLPLRRANLLWHGLLCCGTVS